MAAAVDDSFDVLLVALEVALWGRTGNESSDRTTRWRALLKDCGPAPSGAATVHAMAEEVMTCTYVPPVVELPAGGCACGCGGAFATFLPFVFLGLFRDRGEALDGTIECAHAREGSGVGAGVCWRECAAACVHCVLARPQLWGGGTRTLVGCCRLCALMGAPLCLRTPRMGCGCCALWNGR